MKARFFPVDYRYGFTLLLLIAIVCGAASLCYAQSYYPDEFGNTWILRSTDGIEERAVVIEGPETIGAESLKVISDRTYTIAGRTNGNLNKLFIKTEPHGVLIFRAVASIAVLGQITINYSPPETFLPIPLGLGSEWVVTGKTRILRLIDAEVTNTAKVVAIEDVIVPAGTFRNCLRIQQDVSVSSAVTVAPQRSTMWLAPDVGIVKAVSSNDVTFELIRYEIAIDGTEVAVHPKEQLSMAWGALKKR